MIVRQLLQKKGHHVWSVGPEDSVFEAIRRMADRAIGALLVLEGDRLVGIVSERDYARKVILKQRSSRETSVRDIMTATVFTVPSDATMDDCMAMMTNKRIRHLPVMEHDRVVGVLSIGDIIGTIVAEQGLQIEQLENYIRGG